MIKCLLTEFGGVGWENIWLSVMTHGPRAKYFPVRPDQTQSISTYYPYMSLFAFNFVLQRKYHFSFLLLVSLLISLKR